jgi:NADPH-dependent ferric siderophore reductase
VGGQCDARTTGVSDGARGAYAPDPAADWHLFAGAEAALPAIGAALEALPANAVGPAFIEVARPDDEIELTAAAEVQVRWIYRGGRADLVPEDVAGDHVPLIVAVKAASWRPGRVQVFIHGAARPSCTTCGPISARVRRGLITNCVRTAPRCAA